MPTVIESDTTGECWCGCGDLIEDTTVFFSPGHDRAAEAAVVNVCYGGVPELLEAHGFGPHGRNAWEENNAWRAAGGTVRGATSGPPGA